MRIALIGATGTIGSRVHERLAERHEVLACHRSSPTYAVDITVAPSIRHLLDAIGPIDAIVCAAGDSRFNAMAQLGDADYQVGLDSKLMGQANLARIGADYVRDGGSITLTSGVTGRVPIPGTTSVSMVNGAVECFVRAAALEMPRGIRINAVSPQWTVESLTLFGMDPAWGVPAAQVALGYVESVEGSCTGTVIDAGWRYDASAGSLTVAAA